MIQQESNDDWKPVAFFSKKLTPTQTRYSAFDRELLVIFLAIKHFRNFIKGQDFCVFTDHKPLTTALWTKTERSPRQERQLDFISQFTSDIRYVKGSLNVVADSLSRPNTDSIELLSYGLEELAKEQRNDEELTSFQQKIPKNSSVKLEPSPIPTSDLIPWCETSTYFKRPFVPRSKRQDLFKAIHALSHPGIRTSRKKITRMYFWSHMNRDINTWTRNCVTRQKQKVHRHTKSPCEQISIPPGRFQHIHMDIVGPLSPSDNFKYILTVVDRFSRWPEVYPIHDIRAETIAKIYVHEHVSRFGVPTKITTDQGSQFESKLFSELTKFLGTSRIRTSAYHPQANGMVERFHRQLKAAIRASGNAVNWAHVLPLIMLEIRTSIKDDTKHTPSELLYDENIRLPFDLSILSSEEQTDPTNFVEKLETFFKNIPTFQTRKTETHTHLPNHLSTCDQVLVRSDKVRNSLEPPYEGPFNVIRKLRKQFIVEKGGKAITVSIDRIKPVIKSNANVINKNVTLLKGGDVAYLPADVNAT